MLKQEPRDRPAKLTPAQIEAGAFALAEYDPEEECLSDAVVRIYAAISSSSWQASSKASRASRKSRPPRILTKI